MKVNRKYRRMVICHSSRMGSWKPRWVKQHALYFLNAAGSTRLLSCVLLLAGTAQASPTKLFQQGNKALTEERFEEAINLYMEAAEAAPESAELQYNLGHAQYRTGSFIEAAGSYEFAASLTKTDSMRGRCWYNLGNCMVKIAEGLRADDPHAAASYCFQAAGIYRAALHYDAQLSDAAYNLEITQRFAAEIEEDIQEQREKEQQENELIKYIREKLTEFIERQGVLLNGKIKGTPQQALEKETRALAQVMADSKLHTDIDFPDGTKMPGPLKETYGHTLTAAEAMAVPEQVVALNELIAALGAAPEDPDKQDGDSDEDSENEEDSDMDYEESEEDSEMYEEADPFGDFSEYEEIRGVPPPNKTETDILAEELRNQERRKQKKAGEYKPVEKDW